MSIHSSGEDGIPDYFPDMKDLNAYEVSVMQSGIAVKGEWDERRLYRFSYVRGIEDKDITRYQSLVVLSVRSAYNGEGMAAPNSAYERISGTLRNYTRNPLGVLGRRV